MKTEKAIVKKRETEAKISWNPFFMSDDCKSKHEKSTPRAKAELKKINYFLQYEKRKKRWFPQGKGK